MNEAAIPDIAGEDGLATPREARHAVQKVASQAPDPNAFDRLLSQIGELSHVPIFKESRAQLLIDGPATYRVMGDAIEHAQHSIYVETYIFADDKVGQQFARRLEEKARAGITVCVIYDSLGSMGSSDDFFKDMKAAGVNLIEYNALNPVASTSPLPVNNRDHRKLLIVDDTVAFTGGLNFSETYSSSSPRKPAKAKLTEGWRDTHIAIYGPAVKAFKETFREQWQEQGGVDVRLLVPGISDSNVVLYASKSHYGDLMRQGVRIYENTSSVLHAKTAVIDGIWSTVGSSNLDFRSFLHNDEINAIVLGKDFARQMETQFEIDISGGQSVSMEQWENRPLTDKLQEVFGRSMQYWL